MSDIRSNKKDLIQPNLLKIMSNVETKFNLFDLVLAIMVNWMEDYWTTNNLFIFFWLVLSLEVVWDSIVAFYIWDSVVAFS